MTKEFRRLWLAALALLAGSAFLAPARAAEDTRASRPLVVIVGINDYADTQIKPRTHAEADARALYDLLVGKDHLGVEPDNVRLLLGKEDAGRKSRPATRANVLDAVRWLATSARRNDLVVFAFFGQGSSLGERGDRTCYFASDSTVKGRVKDAVAAADLAQEFDRLRSHRLCVLLDAPFVNTAAPGKDAPPEPSFGETPYKEFLGDDGTEEHNPQPGRAVFLATPGLSTTPDLKEHGLFGKVVLDGLSGEADKDGYEPDGVVTVDELASYLGKQVPERLKAIDKKPDELRRRDPLIIGGQESHFSLTTNPRAIGKARERLDKFRTLAKDDQLDKELVEEGERLLGRMPRLEAQRKLRKEYQKLVDRGQTVEQFVAARTAVLASTRLPGHVAADFARKVMKAADLVDAEYVKEVEKGELVAWAIRGLYRRLDEKVPEDVDARLDRVKNLAAAELPALLLDVRSRLGQREDLDNHKDIDIALQRMLAKLDPYTTYVDPETVERFRTEYRGQFTGVGIQIRKDSATDMLQVVTPIKDSPSHQLGVQAGDLISGITREVDSEGKPLEQPEVLSTKTLALTDCVKKIQGKAGTRVKLSVVRDGKEMQVEITRRRIELESVFGVKRNADDSWNYWLDSERKLAYIRLGNFARNTYDDLQAAVRKLRREGVRGLVLDLRFNPGGLLSAAEEISDLFIDDGPIVSIRQPRKAQDDPIKGRSAGSQLDFPMVVLVNNYSASASEIVSACLQDHRRAVVMGERSYGKGSVQNITPFDGGEIKLTVATFWRPSGKNLNKSSTSGKDDEEWGVKPDKGFTLELTRKEREDLAEHQRNSEIIQRRDKPAPKSEFKDRQLEMAADYLREQIRAASR